MEKSKIRFIGRHIEKEGKEYFSFSGCGFEFAIHSFYAKCLVTLSLESQTRDYEYQYIAIFINDELTSKERLKQGTNEIKLSLSNSIGRTIIRVIKLNEVYLSSIYLRNISLSDATFDDLEPSKRKLIGFFGDSITCGFGNIDYQGQEFKMEKEDFTKSYAYLAASNLNMDYSVVARSGIALSFPIYVDKLFNEIYDTVDMDELYQPERKLDYAVINLGTNDSNGIVQVTKEDEIKREYQLFKERYITLIQRIIKDNPGVKIIMCYCMLPLKEIMIQTLKDIYQIISSKYENKICLAEFVPNGDGACFHPYYTAHEEASKLLIKLIKELNSI